MGGVRERIARPLLEVRDIGRRLAELNIELMKAELKRATARYGAAVALFVAAAIIAFFAVGFLLATIAVALDIVLPLWASMAVVTGLLLLLVAIMALAGKHLATSAKAPVSGSAMTEAQVTMQAVKAGVQSVARRGKTGAEVAAEAARQAPETAAAAAPPTPPVPADEIDGPLPGAARQSATPSRGGDDAPE